MDASRQQEGSTSTLPPIGKAELLSGGVPRLLIGAYGFEERSLGWVRMQTDADAISRALVFKYKNPKGNNRVKQLREGIARLGASSIGEIVCDVHYPYGIESGVAQTFRQELGACAEVVIDISAMTKLLILVCLCALSSFPGTVRVVYSEAERYAPSYEEYVDARKNMGAIAKYPSRGIESIIRLKCLSSVRMQGQPVTLIAFTSFNEQLVRHILGTITPHRLLFINGRPPRADFAWRERATQEIHNKLIEEYAADNPVDERGRLARVASTLDYRETVACIDSVYGQYGNYERIMCSATGSKMQTVGLFLAKVKHPDIHIEYPTPDSYFVKGMSEAIASVHECVFPRFADFLQEISRVRLASELAAELMAEVKSDFEM